MKINFRQGIFSSAKDGAGNPSFLTLKTDKTVKLSATETPVVLSFAYKDSGNFLVEIRKDVEIAWGPFNDTSVDSWLYWDVNLGTGALTTGVTHQYPLYQSSAPIAPPQDQHWFDTSSTIMKVWNGSSWVEKIRLFACKIDHGITLQHTPFGSQAGIVKEVDAGYILFDESGMPVRRSNGLFFTTDTSASLNFSNTVTSFKLDQNVLVLSAVESIPAYALVAIAGPNQMCLADINSTDKRAIGMVVQDAATGNVSEVVFRGVLTSLDWSKVTDTQVTEFPSVLAGKSLWLVANGKMSWFRPTSVVAQRIGTIINPTSIYLDIDTETMSEEESVNTSIKGIATDYPLVTTGGTLPTISIKPATIYQAGSMTPADKTALQSVIEALSVEIADRTAALALKLSTTGGTLSGYLTLSGDPILGRHAATKDYVDHHPGTEGPQGPRGEKGEKGEKGDTGTVSYDSPQLIGSPTAPTQTIGTNNTTLATTEFVTRADSNIYNSILGGVGGSLDNLKKLADAVGNNPNFANAVTGDLSNRLRFDTIQYITTAQKQNVITSIGLSAIAISGNYEDLQNKPKRPAISGDITIAEDGTIATLPTVTTAGTYRSVVVNEKGLVTGGTSPTTLAGYGITDALSANNAVLTGVPTAPTPAASDNSNQIANTAFVRNLMAANSGIATLNSSGKLSTSQIPDALIGAVVYQGLWNASTNTPTLLSGVGVKGQYYKVSVTGTTTLDGISQWNAGDTVIFDGATWSTLSGAGGVLSVAGRTGAITLNVADILGAAELASPIFTGVPKAPKASLDTDTDQIATTSFVKGQAASALPYMAGIASAGVAQTFSRWDHIHPVDTSRAPIASPVFTGIPTADTAPIDTNTKQLATTQFVISQGYVKQSTVTANYATLDSAILTGNPRAPTVALTDNSKSIATTEFVKGQGYLTSASVLVSSVAGKTGAVTLTTDDISGEIDGGSF